MVSLDQQEEANGANQRQEANAETVESGEKKIFEDLELSLPRIPSRVVPKFADPRKSYMPLPEEIALNSSVEGHGRFGRVFAEELSDIVQSLGSIESIKVATQELRTNLESYGITTPADVTELMKDMRAIEEAQAQPETMAYLSRIRRSMIHDLRRESNIGEDKR